MPGTLILHFCYIANSYIYRVHILNGSVLHNLPGIRRYKFRNLHDFLNIIYLGFKFKESFKIFLFLFFFFNIFNWLKNIGIFLLLLKEQFLSNISYRKVVLDQQCLFYIFRLGIKLQATYPDLVPRYRVRIHLLHDPLMILGTVTMYNTVDHISLIEFIWRLYLDILFY